MVSSTSPNHKPQTHITKQPVSKSSSCLKQKPSHTTGFGEASWSFFTSTPGCHPQLYPLALAVRAHLHLGGQRLALLSDIIQDDVCILHVFSFAFPLCHVALQSKNAH